MTAPWKPDLKISFITQTDIISDELEKEVNAVVILYEKFEKRYSGKSQMSVGSQRSLSNDDDDA